MIVLALDVTGEHGGIAIARDQEILVEHALEAQTGFGEILFPALERALNAAGLTLSAVDCFAAASGPGTFTGVRVGLAAVKGLAEACGRGAVGVSNLKALAWHGATNRRAAISDARRGEVYGAIYDGGLRLLTPEVACPLSSFLTGVGDAEFVSQHPVWLSPQLPPDARITEAPVQLSIAVAHCALSDLAGGGQTDPLFLEANYVRRSDAHKVWHDRPKGEP